jgi:hypothetical protein
MTPRPVRSWLLGAVLLVSAAPASSQPATPAAPATTPASTSTPPAAWTWAVDANTFGGYNYQRRAFTDFAAWESQNWLMASAARAAGAWTTTATVGFTLEPATIGAIGSPQAFQTGETFKNAPLIDYQHPHDVLMVVGAETARAFTRATVRVGAALVGAPPIGPPPFMHRASAAENPQAPLSHHYLDSTHSTQGLVRGGITIGALTVNAGAFHGREPDERRTDVDLGRLDSYAVQVAVARGRWSGQVSSAWLTRPERLSTYDAERHTASLSYEWRDGERSLAWTAATGQNREVHGHLEAYLVEATWRWSARYAVYLRAEQVAKDILDAGFHPIGVGHRHRQSNVGALTTGAVRDVVSGRHGRFGVGADVTVYRVPSNLSEAYGRPVSVHAFLRLRGRAGTPATTDHVHRH